MRRPPFADILKILFQMIFKEGATVPHESCPFRLDIQTATTSKKIVAPDLLDPKHSLINTPPLQNAGMIFLKLGKLAVVKKPLLAANVQAKAGFAEARYVNFPHESRYVFLYSFLTKCNKPPQRWLYCDTHTTGEYITNTTAKYSETPRAKCSGAPRAHVAVPVAAKRLSAPCANS